MTRMAADVLRGAAFGLVVVAAWFVLAVLLTLGRAGAETVGLWRDYGFALVASAALLAVHLCSRR